MSKNKEEIEVTTTNDKQEVAAAIVPTQEEVYKELRKKLAIATRKSKYIGAGLGIFAAPLIYAGVVAAGLTGIVGIVVATTIFPVLLYVLDKAIESTITLFTRQ